MEITAAAKEKLTEVQKKNPGKNLRVYVSGFGWCGPKLGVALDEPQINETAAKVDGFNVLISYDAHALAEISTIDYIRGKYGEGFIIDHDAFSAR